MKRDWVQTGRKPSGLCGAAFYISALSHGHKYTKSHIVDGYIHNEEEKHYKKIIWEELNREYIEEQLAKEAAAKTAYEANLRNCPEGMEDAQKLAADAATAAAKLRKERQQKRAAEARRNSTPPQTAAEATCQMLAKKRLDSKINYAVLDSAGRSV